MSGPDVRSKPKSQAAETQQVSEWWKTVIKAVVIVVLLAVAVIRCAQEAGSVWAILTGADAWSHWALAGAILVFAVGCWEVCHYGAHVVGHVRRVAALARKAVGRIEIQPALETCRLIWAVFIWILCG